jgi:hypothetical protein
MKNENVPLKLQHLYSSPHLESRSRAHARFSDDGTRFVQTRASPELLAATAWLKRHISRLQSLIANRHVENTGVTVLDDSFSMRFSQDSPPATPIRCSNARPP